MSNYMTEQEKFEAERLIKESQEAYEDRDFDLQEWRHGPQRGH